MKYLSGRLTLIMVAFGLITGQIHASHPPLAANSSAPYGGRPWSIPGRVEAEDFDEGGEGVAYHDTEAHNYGPYRTDEGVDVLSGGSGKKVGYIKPGEWLNYSVNVRAADKYVLRIRIGSPASTSTFRVESDGVDLTGPVAIQNSGGYDNWYMLDADLELDAGEQVLRLVFETSDPYVADIDWFEVVDSASAAKDEFFDMLVFDRVESDSTVNWTQVAPGNAGFANLLRYHPTIPGKVAFCPDMLNLYQSDNNGSSWYNIKDPDGNGEMTHLRDLYYSPSHAEFALALEGSQVWQSQDTGRTWAIVPNCPWYVVDGDGSDREGWKNKVASLAIDPLDKDTWFVGGGSNVRGQDWLSCYKDNSAENPRGSIHVNQGKLWKTDNAGESWTLINSGLDPKVQIGRIIVNPKNTQQVFASSQYGVYRSDDGGMNWTQVSEGKLDNDIIMDMDFYYDEGTGSFVLYLIDQVHYLADGNSSRCSGGIFRSEDEGNNWIKMNGDLYLDLKRLTGGVSNNYYKYLGIWLGINASTARSRYPVLPDSALQYFSMISVDPSREGALYIGFEDPQIGNSIVPGRIWTTSNKGEKWINTARLYEHVWEADKEYWEERGNPWHENMVVGHESPHMQFGNDYALRSVRAIHAGVDGSVMMISDHNTMLSTDYGESWHQVDEDYTPEGNIMGRGNSNLPAHSMVQDNRLDHIVLGSGEHRVWIPTGDGTDGRQAMKFIESAQETVSAMATDPYDAQIIYATSHRQQHKENVFRSTDGGYHWSNYGRATPVSSSIWGEDMRTHALTVDPIDENILYFGATDMTDPVKFENRNGFFFSDNRGKSFVNRNTGLPKNARVQDILIDPRDSSGRSLFIAAEKNVFSYHQPLADGGLYHTDKRGESWTKVHTPSSVQGVTYMAMDQSQRMYITTGYRGGGDGVWYTDDFGENWTQVFKYAGAECIDISPYDHKLIIVSVGFLSKNPGVYVSRDRGKTWTKTNRDIGIPHKIHTLEFDIHDASRLWLATVGCGFYLGEIQDGDSVQVVEITPRSLDYRDGVETQLSADIIREDQEGNTMSWKSDNPAIASVDENGLVTPLSRGKTTIWATTGEDGRWSDNCVFVVHEIATDSMELIKDISEVYTGEILQLECKLYPAGSTDRNFTWESLDPSKAKVSSTGEVSGMEPGTVRIRVSHSEGRFTDSLDIQVQETMVEQLTLSDTLISIYLGQIEKLTAEVIPAHAYNTDLSWISRDEKVVLVNAGELSGVNPGESYVIALNERSGVSDSCRVLVKDPTAIDDLRSGGIRIYPVPADQSFRIEGAADKSLVSIYDLAGTLVLQTRLEKEVHVEDLNAGTYLVKIISGDSTIFRKLVKQ